MRYDLQPRAQSNASSAIVLHGRVVWSVLIAGAVLTGAGTLHLWGGLIIVHV